MQHHVDEFSVTDIRHTLSEAWRVVRERRWWFVFPGCIAAVLAFAGSHFVPRKYTTSMTFERRNDPVLQGVLAERWMMAYAEQRKRLRLDLARDDVIEQTVAKLDLPRGRPRGPNGELMPATPGARQAFCKEIVTGLKSGLLEKTQNRDLVVLDLTMSDPKFAPEILEGILAEYAEVMRTQTMDVMKSAQAFYKERTAQSKLVVERVELQCREYQKNYRGIESVLADPTASERNWLLQDRSRVVEQLDDALAKGDQIDRMLARLDTSDRAEDAEPSEDGEAPGDPSLVPNPRYAQLHDEIQRLRREIADNKKLRSMTDMHPSILTLRKKIESRGEELAETPPRVPAGEVALAVVLATGSSESEYERLTRQRKHLSAGIQRLETRLKNADRDIKTSRRRLNDILENREDYRRVALEAEELRADYNRWHSHLGPLAQALTLENNDRGIHFTITKRPALATKPSAPASLTLILACVAFAVGVGVICVLLAELSDRSFRTTKQLSSSLGIPVIETVDEIITRALRKKRLIRRFVVLPAATTLMLMASTIAGTMAYLSLENPARYDQIKTMPKRAVQDLLGRL